MFHLFKCMAKHSEVDTFFSYIYIYNEDFLSKVNPQFLNKI